MRNAIISIILFIGLMLGIYFLNNSILDLCTEIQTQTDQIEFVMNQNDFETAYSLSVELLNSIQSKNFITSIYLNHQEFDNLINESVRLCVYIIYEDESEAHTSLHLLKYNTDHIRNLQLLKLENIF